MDSGADKGEGPTKSRGAGEVKPCANFISLAFSQPAGYCKFKSIPVGFKIYQPNIKNNKMQ